MEESGSVDFMFTGFTPSSLVMLPSPALKDDAAKELHARFIRLWCILAGVTAGVLSMEVWMRTARPGEKLDPGTRPSLSPDRREGVFLSGEAMGGIYLQRFLPILRDGSGRFTGFGPAESFPSGPAGGRFGRPLPDHAPSEAEQEAAAEGLVAIARCSREGSEPSAAAGHGG